MTFFERKIQILLYNSSNHPPVDTYDIRKQNYKVKVKVSATQT